MCLWQPRQLGALAEEETQAGRVGNRLPTVRTLQTGTERCVRPADTVGRAHGGEEPHDGYTGDRKVCSGAAGGRSQKPHHRNKQKFLSHVAENMRKSCFVAGSKQARNMLKGTFVELHLNSREQL